MKSISLVKSFSLYTLLNVLNAAVPFLLLPFFSYYLSPEDYGKYANFQGVANLFFIFVVFSFPAFISRVFIEKTTDFSSYLSRGITLSLLMSVLLTLIAGVGISFWKHLTQLPAYVIMTIPVLGFLFSLYEYYLTILRMQENIKLYGILRIGKTFVELITALLLIITTQAGWKALFVGMILALTLVGFIALLKMIKEYTIRLSINEVIKKDKLTLRILRFCMPIIPHSLSAILLAYSDKFMITAFVGIAENGLYSFGYQVGMIVSLLQNSFNQSWVPWLFNKLNTHKNDKSFKIQLVKITYIYSFFMIAVVVALYFFLPVIFYFLSDNYQGSEKFVFWISLGYAFNGLYKMMVNYIMYEEKTILVMYVTITVALINIILNILFLQYFGVIGAAYASCIAFFFQFVFTWYLSQKIYPLPWTIVFNKKRI